MSVFYSPQVTRARRQLDLVRDLHSRGVRRDQIDWERAEELLADKERPVAEISSALHEELRARPAPEAPAPEPEPDPPTPRSPAAEAAAPEPTEVEFTLDKDVPDEDA